MYGCKLVFVAEAPAAAVVPETVTAWVWSAEALPIEVETVTPVAAVEVACVDVPSHA